MKTYKKITLGAVLVIVIAAAVCFIWFSPAEVLKGSLNLFEPESFRPGVKSGFEPESFRPKNRGFAPETFKPAPKSFEPMDN